MNDLPVPEWTTRAARIATPRRRSDVVVRELDDEVIFADPLTGCSYHLNQTAWFVWQHCDGTTTTRDIAAMITETQEIDEKVAVNDVEEVVGWFASQRLCEEPNDP